MKKISKLLRRAYVGASILVEITIFGVFILLSTSIFLILILFHLSRIMDDDTIDDAIYVMDTLIKAEHERIVGKIHDYVAEFQPERMDEFRRKRREMDQ